MFKDKRNYKCRVCVRFAEVRQEAVQQALAAMQSRPKPSLPMPSKRTSVMARSPDRSAGTRNDTGECERGRDYNFGWSAHPDLCKDGEIISRAQCRIDRPGRYATRANVCFPWRQNVKEIRRRYDPRNLTRCFWNFSNPTFPIPIVTRRVSEYVLIESLRSSFYRFFRFLNFSLSFIAIVRTYT